MNLGKIFEADWKSSIVKDEMYYLRLKDSPSSFGQDSGKVRFTAKNPYDALVFYKNRLFPMELKFTQSTSFSIQRDKKEKPKMIKFSQIEGLTEANKYKYVYAGLLLNFGDKKTNENDLYWISIVDFNRFLKDTDKKSINKKDVIEYNGIKCQSRILKVRHRYSTKELLDIIVKQKEDEYAKTNV